MPEQRSDCRASYTAVRGKRKFYQALIADLAAFAASEFELNALQEDGTPLRAHLESLWRNSGEQPKQLAEAPALPALAAHVWGWFIELDKGRGNNGMEAARITPDQVTGWMWFNGVLSLELWERKAIAALDNVWFAAQRKVK